MSSPNELIPPDIKLTKNAKIISQGDIIVINKVLESETINLNEWIGLALNPNLTDKHIETIYTRLKELSAAERDDKTINVATKTKNTGLMSKIKKIIAAHKNMTDDMIANSIKTSTSIAILSNPNIKPDHLNLFFDLYVLFEKNTYSFIRFKYLMQSKNLSKPLVLKWYYTLLHYADWTYADNSWYAIVVALLDWEDCPIEILTAIVSAPYNETPYARSERYRMMAINHKNGSTIHLSEIAYKVTKDTKYLPETVKDLFVF